jgi:hypothetical protein
LLVRERPDLGAGQCQNADRDAFMHHRNADCSTDFTHIQGFGKSVILVHSNVVDVDDLTFDQSSSRGGAAIDLHGQVLHTFRKFRCETKRCRTKKCAIFLAGNGAVVGVA